MTEPDQFEMRVGGAAESARNLRQLVGENYSAMYDLVEAPLDTMELLGGQLDMAGLEAPASLWQRYQDSQRDVLAAVREEPDETAESFADLVRREAAENVVQLVPKPKTGTERKTLVPVLIRGGAPPGDGPKKPIHLPWMEWKGDVA